MIFLLEGSIASMDKQPLVESSALRFFQSPHSFDLGRAGEGKEYHHHCDGDRGTFPRTFQSFP